MRRSSVLFVLGAWLVACAAVQAQGPTLPGTGTPPQPVVPPKEKKTDWKAKPDSLEQLIAEALKYNPDIRVAEAKAREADAEVNRTRMKVVSDITFLQAEIQAAQEMMHYAEKQHARLSALYKSGTIEIRLVDEASLAFEKAKADLAVKQAKLPYLLGRQSGKAVSTGLIDDLLRRKLLEAKSDTKITDEEFLRRVMLDLLGRVPTADEMKVMLKMPDKDRREKWIDQLLKEKPQPMLRHWLVDKNQGCIQCHVTQKSTAPLHAYGLPLDHPPVDRLLVERHWQLFFKLETPLTDKLRTALDRKIRMDANKMSPNLFLDHVREKLLPGINLHVRAKALKADAIDVKMPEPVPVGAVLQYLEDEYDIVFVLRDYGIVVVGATERRPPDSVRVIDFWKHGKSETKQDTKEKK